MRREWVFFDVEVIGSELASLPSKDAAKLTALMKHYEEVGLANPSPAQIDDYGNDIKRLRHVKDAYQGRALFFAIDRSRGYERLVVLTVYKKEGQDVPRNVLERAIARKAAYERGRK